MDNETYLLVSIFESLGLLSEKDAEKLAKELVTTNVAYYTSTYDAIHTKVKEIFEQLKIQGFDLEASKRKVDIVE
jgi:hypothetical protein